MIFRQALINTASIDMTEQEHASPINIDSILTRSPDAPISSAKDLFCELPSCDLVLQSRLESHRCEALGQNTPDTWPLLITATPRSGTVYMQSSLLNHGMEIQQDWNEAKRDGRVSWMYAFDDLKSFGPAKAHGKRFRTVLHQTKEPLSSITSMCTEPILSREKAFLQRHIPLPSSYEKKELYWTISSRVCLEFWVKWQTFITAMRFPTYKVSEVELRDIFDISG